MSTLTEVVDNLAISPAHMVAARLGMKLVEQGAVETTNAIESYLEDVLRLDWGTYEAAKFGMALQLLGSFDKAAAWFVEDEDRENIGADMSGPVTAGMVEELIAFYDRNN